MLESVTYGGAEIWIRLNRRWIVRRASAASTPAWVGSARMKYDVVVSACAATSRSTVEFSLSTLCNVAPGAEQPFRSVEVAPVELPR